MRRMSVIMLVCSAAAFPLATVAHARSLVGGQHSSRLGQLRAAAARHFLTVRIVERRASVRYWQRVMHRPLAATTYSEEQLRERNVDYLKRTASIWGQRARTVVAAAKMPPHLADWLCIQRHETAPPYPGWRTASGNTYYGGLQMDRSFQQSYAPWLYEHKGTAERWGLLEQIWTAEYARTHGRGFGPWPNTARDCGLR